MIWLLNKWREPEPIAVLCAPRASNPLECCSTRLPQPLARPVELAVHAHLGQPHIGGRRRENCPAPYSSYTNGVPTVHMSAGNFDQASVTIAKDARLLLVDDVAVPRIIANGSWQNGVAHPAKEPGAPTVNNVQVNGNSAEIGPFSTAGNYQLYCTIHPDMGLSVAVQ